MHREYIEQRNGGYYVAGTRISLDSVVYAFNRGESPEQILDLRDAEDTGRSRRFSRAGDGRIDAVPAGRHPMSRPGAGEGREVHRSQGE